VIAPKQEVSWNNELVPFLKIKEQFAKLHRDSLLRRMVLAEPDYMPRQEAIRKSLDYLELYEKLEKEKALSPLVRR
jgi:hypothetical protein